MIKQAYHVKLQEHRDRKKRVGHCPNQPLHLSLVWIEDKCIRISECSSSCEFFFFFFFLCKPVTTSLFKMQDVFVAAFLITATHVTSVLTTPVTTSKPQVPKLVSLQVLQMRCLNLGRSGNGRRVFSSAGPASNKEMMVKFTEFLATRFRHLAMSPPHSGILDPTRPLVQWDMLL